MKKCIITVVGKDKVGIIAGVCQYLSDISVYLRFSDLYDLPR